MNERVNSRYDLSVFPLVLHRCLSLSGPLMTSAFCPLSPFHNYVSCHIMQSQSALSPPPATLTFVHSASKILSWKSLAGLGGWKAIKWSARSLKLCHCWPLTPNLMLHSPLQGERGIADTTGFLPSVPEESFTLSRSSQPTDHQVRQWLCKVTNSQDP